MPGGRQGLGVPGTVTVELRVREAFKLGGLAGSGVIVVNLAKFYWPDTNSDSKIVPCHSSIGGGNLLISQGKWNIGSPTTAT